MSLIIIKHNEVQTRNLGVFYRRAFDFKNPKVVHVHEDRSAVDLAEIESGGRSHESCDSDGYSRHPGPITRGNG